MFLWQNIMEPSMTHLEKIHSSLSTLTKKIWSEEEIKAVNLCLHINWYLLHLAHCLWAQLAKTQSFHMKPNKNVFISWLATGSWQQQLVCNTRMNHGCHTILLLSCAKLLELLCMSERSKHIQKHSCNKKSTTKGGQSCHVDLKIDLYIFHY